MRSALRKNECKRTKVSANFECNVETETETETETEKISSFVNRQSHSIRLTVFIIYPKPPAIACTNNNEF